MESGEMWRQEVQKLRDAEYPDVELAHMYADIARCSSYAIPSSSTSSSPTTSSRSILSDCAAMLTGSLGNAALGLARCPPIRPAAARRSTSPCTAAPPTIRRHRTAANPLACMLSFSMMLRYSFDLADEADLVDTAVKRVLDSGVRTGDIMQPGMTQDLDRRDGRCDPSRRSENSRPSFPQTASGRPAATQLGSPRGVCFVGRIEADGLRTRGRRAGG